MELRERVNFIVQKLEDADLLSNVKSALTVVQHLTKLRQAIDNNMLNMLDRRVHVKQGTTDAAIWASSEAEGGQSIIPESSTAASKDSSLCPMQLIDNALKLCMTMHKAELMWQGCDCPSCGKQSCLVMHNRTVMVTLLTTTGPVLAILVSVPCLHRHSLLLLSAACLASTQCCLGHYNSDGVLTLFAEAQAVQGVPRSHLCAHCKMRGYRQQGRRTDLEGIVGESRYCIAACIDTAGSSQLKQVSA